LVLARKRPIRWGRAVDGVRPHRAGGDELRVQAAERLRRADA